MQQVFEVPEVTDVTEAHKACLSVALIGFEMREMKKAICCILLQTGQIELL